METVTSKNKRKLTPQEEEARTARAYARKRRQEGVSGAAAAVVEAYENVVGKPGSTKTVAKSESPDDDSVPKRSSEKAQHDAVMDEIRQLQRQHLHGGPHP